MARKTNLSAERLRAVLHYDPQTGDFVRRLKSKNRHQREAVAGSIRPDGYRRIGVDMHSYLAHRLAWLYVHGVWPAGEIDHINHDPSDNRISNLRDVPATLNQHNQVKAHSHGKTGLLGASWNSRRRNFVAQIKVGPRIHWLGAYATAEAAHAVYIQAKQQLHEGFQP